MQFDSSVTLVLATRIVLLLFGSALGSLLDLDCFKSILRRNLGADLAPIDISVLRETLLSPELDYASGVRLRDVIHVYYITQLISVPLELVKEFFVALDALLGILVDQDWLQDVLVQDEEAFGKATKVFRHRRPLAEHIVFSLRVKLTNGDHCLAILFGLLVTFLQVRMGEFLMLACSSFALGLLEFSRRYFEQLGSQLVSFEVVIRVLSGYLGWRIFFRLNCCILLDTA